MEITILLKQYCIKTAAKRKHSTLIHQYFGGAFSGRKKLAAEEQIEALKFFLEKMDFKRRHFCPSCHQKRGVEYGEWLITNVLKNVPYKQ